MSKKEELRNQLNKIIVQSIKPYYTFKGKYEDLKELSIDGAASKIESLIEANFVEKEKIEEENIHSFQRGWDYAKSRNFKSYIEALSYYHGELKQKLLN